MSAITCARPAAGRSACSISGRSGWLLTETKASYAFDRAWTLSVGANNLFNEYPDQVNAQLLAEQRANLDNAAVTIHPSIPPFGINDSYYDARLAVKL